MKKTVKPKKTLTEAAANINEVSESWDGKQSIDVVIVRAAKRQSDDPVFNAAAWMKFNFGPRYYGEEDKDWIRTVKDILKINS